MALINTRGKTAAVILKLEEGDLQKPTKGEEYVALQADFALTPAFETIENLEIKDDIMAAKSVIGGETPSGTFSHYLTGSGTEGKIPEYHPFLFSSFGSYRNPRLESDTEDLTVAGSTTSKIMVNNSGALTFDKGEALLIKDDVNGWSIRPVKSQDTVNKAYNLAFALENAPAAGVRVGKAITYVPQASGQPVFDVWEYFAGGNGNQNVVNCRTVSFSVSADADANINSTFGFEGTSYRLNEDFSTSFTTTTQMRDVAVQYGATPTKVTLRLATTLNKATGAAAATELQTKMRALSGPTGWSSMTVAFRNDRFTFTIPANGSAFYFDFDDSDTHAGMRKFLGFSSGRSPVASPSSSSAGSMTSTTFAGDRDYSSGIDAVYDSQDPAIARDQRLFVGDEFDNVCLDATSVSLAVNTPKTIIKSVCSPDGNFATILTSRDATLSVTALLQQDDQRFFSKFKNGDPIQFAFLGGQKRNGQWVPGNCFSLYGSEASISSFSLGEADGVYNLSLDLLCYSPGDGTGSIFLSFL